MNNKKQSREPLHSRQTPPCVHCVVAIQSLLGSQDQLAQKIQDHLPTFSL